MPSRLPILFTLFAAVAFFQITHAAEMDYQQAADDINQRLNKTLALYDTGKIDEAKRTVQMAYFEVFESIEGPVRINYSQKYAYQLEAKFGEIRKLIAARAPREKVAQEINWLKTQVSTVPDILTSGHQLVAEEADVDQSSVKPYWREQVLSIESQLNQALSAYRESQNSTQEDAEEKRNDAAELIQQAQFEHYKNSDLETAIRTQRSGTEASHFNDQFKEMLIAVRKPFTMQALVAFGYQVSTLTENLKDNLPGLELTKESQKEDSLDDNTSGVQDWPAVVNRIDRAVSEAIDTFQQGDISAAMMAVQDAYFDEFEASGMENALGSRDSGCKAELEGYFTRIVSMMKAGSQTTAIQEQQQQLRQGLDNAVAMLSEDNSGFWSIFIASFMIMLREGLEALLIVAAISAYLVKNGHSDKLQIIKNSVIVALVASLITALLFMWLFTNSGANRELLEGVSMLIAAVVLFCMSYWLLSKVEANHWKHYLENKLADSLGAGSIAGLWFASFLAVYREGAETILFYYALGAGGSAGSLIALLSGLAVGVIVLLVIFIITRFTVVKLPLKPFFMFTGGFMYLMAFVFSGQGVLELIEAQLFSPTLVKSAPQIPVLGIYPYVETLTPQIALLIAAVIALIVINKRGSDIK